MNVFGFATGSGQKILEDKGQLMLKIAVVLGTRPEIIKMSPVIRELEKIKSNYFVLHTGQHYSYNMDKVFFEQLKLTDVKYNLEVGSGSHAAQTARILIEIEKVYSIEKPDIILVQGDTNTVLAGALAATKLHIKIGHIEAGLRSYDRQMPEEINRILTDHCSDYLFAPTEKCKDILKSEGIPENKIFVTGNTIVDAVQQNLRIINDKGLLLDRLHLKPEEYFLVTLHRQENVDAPLNFESILQGLEQLASIYRIPVIYPVHPRSRKMMREFNLKPQNIRLLEPLDYLDFLQLEKYAKLILTDSGGIQEEGCILGVPCVTLRGNTERPETLEVGANILAGIDPVRIWASAKFMLNKENGWQNPFGDGHAAQRIISVLTK
jgi:UDP-N-acetylglucosamine 2-epimerase (non-hydrolysing)